MSFIEENNQKLFCASDKLENFHVPTPLIELLIIFISLNYEENLKQKLKKKKSGQFRISSVAFFMYLL